MTHGGAMVARIRTFINESTAISATVVWTVGGCLFIGAFWAGFCFFRLDDHEKRITAAEDRAEKILATVQEIRVDVRGLMGERNGNRSDGGTRYSSPGSRSQDEASLRGRPDSPRIPDESDVRAAKHERSTRPVEDGS